MEAQARMDSTTVGSTAGQTGAAEGRGEAAAREEADVPDAADAAAGRERVVAATAAAPDAPLSAAERDHAADRRLGVRVISFLLALCLSVAGYGAVSAARHGGSAAAARSAKLAKLPAPPPPRLLQIVADTFTIPGMAPNIPWPSSGQAAVEIEGVGSLGTSGHVSTPVPIASVAKTMTAYLILADHPLAAGDS